MSPSDERGSAVGDWRGLGDLVAVATTRLTMPVEGMHDAIADRWFGLAGPTAAPVRRLYALATSGAYASVRLTGSVLGAAVGTGAAEVAARRNRLPAVFRSSFGSGVQSAFNALWGDEFERRRSPLRVELGLRDPAGEPIRAEPSALADAFPRPTARLAVLLHGLGHTERSWRRATDDDATTHGLGDVLAGDSYTPLLVRYNTGRHVSDNGAALAELLEQITRAWPVAVQEIALVGHSMGGLVARSSLHAGRTVGHRWADAARHVVALGSPHLGAPLEKATNVVSWGLRLAPESRPLGEFLDLRSVGIKDLRFGATREVDWQGVEPDALLRDVVGDVPLPAGVEQHFVAGVITGEPTHPVGLLLGDLVVRVPSGTGRSRHRRVEATHVRVLGGRHHVDLLHDPAVHAQVRTWLGTAEQGPD